MIRGRERSLVWFFIFMTQAINFKGAAKDVASNAAQLCTEL
jgi:hypothetical protein